MSAVAAKRIAGLYAITRDVRDTAQLEREVRAALRGGTSIVQYRNKTATPELQHEQALALKRICAEHDAMLIVNDDVDLARAIDADGVHVGRDDMALQSTREALGADKVIGVSCYDRVARAIDAERAGADYVAFGSFFASSVKPDAVRPKPELLSNAKRTLHVPIVAIGGITIGNAPALVSAGADAVAVISGLFGADDIEAAARRFVACFEHSL